MENNKEITQGHAARLKIKAGIDKACDAVRPTLGPIGMTAIIEFPGLDPIECDDGVTILKNLMLKDHYEQMGVLKLRKGAIRTSTEVGDGTATTTVLTQAFANEAFKEIAIDSSKIREVRERLETGLALTLSELTKIKRDVSDEDIERIATVSSLDPEIAKHIADVIKDVGVHGVVTVEKGHKLGYSKEIVKGARFDKGMISPFFITNQTNNTAELEDAYVVLADRKISSNEQILSLLNSIGTGKSILFIADDIDSVALATLAQNAINRVARIACVKNPYSASRARDFLFDMAALTGATVISEEAGMKLSEATVAQCGRAKKVIVSRDTTTIIEGKAGEGFDARVTQIKDLIENTPSEYEREILEDRLASLTGGIGVIRVGAYTDTDFNTKKYKFENAINATQAALQEGILPGGGSALAKVQIEDPIFKAALIEPFKQMSKNAGLEWYKFIANISDPNNSNGVDFKNKKAVDMFESGIIDPYKVTRMALESAVAIVLSLISIETAIVIEEEVKDNGK